MGIPAGNPQIQNTLNQIVKQLLSAPGTLPFAPATIPSILANELQAKVQKGTLTPNTTAINTPMSGVFGQLQTSTTLIYEGALQNPGPLYVAVAANPAGNGAMQIGTSGIFNFGPIDLSMIYVATVGSNNPQQVNVYWES